MTEKTNFSVQDSTATFGGYTKLAIKTKFMVDNSTVTFQKVSEILDASDMAVSNNSNVTFNGVATFKGHDKDDMHVNATVDNSTITFNSNANFNKNVNFSSTNSTVTFEGTTTATDNAALIFNSGMVSFNRTNLNNTSSLTVKNGVETATFGNAATLNHTANLTVEGGTTTFKAITASANSKVNFSGDKNTISGTTTLNDNAALTSSAGTLTFDESVTMNGNSSLTASGGDITLNKGVSLAGTSSLNISTTVTSNDQTSLDGGSSISLNQGGTLTLAGTASPYNRLKRGTANGQSASFNFNGGTLVAQDSYTIFQDWDANDNLNLAATSTVQVESGKTLTFANTASLKGTDASATLNKTGTGQLTLLADNTYAGETKVQQGTLQVGDNRETGILGTGRVSLAESTNLIIKRSNQYIVNNEISGSGTLEQAGSGMTVLTNDNANYTGAINIISGTLQVGNDGATGDLGTGNVTISSGANLKVNRSNDYTLDNLLTGEGNLIHDGAGTTTVNNKDNSFSGNTSITGGTLQFDSFAAMGRGTSAISTGTSDTKKGTLKLNFDANETFSRNINGAGNFEKSNTHTTTTTGDLTHSGKTTVSGGELIVDGKIEGTSDVLIDNKSTFATDPNVAKLAVNGTLTTAKTGNDSGDVEVNNGTLTVANGGIATVGNIKTTDAAGDDQATVTVNEGGTLTTNLVTGDTLFENFKKAAATDTITINGTWNANVAENADVSQQEDAAFTGTGTFNKTGKGTLALDADNSISTTNINNGKLQVKAGKTLTSPTISVGDAQDGENSAQLENLGTVDAETITVKSDGKLTNTGAGTLKATKALVVASGNVALNGGTTTVEKMDLNDGTVTVAQGASFTGNTVNIGDGQAKPNSDPEQTTNTAKFEVQGTATINGPMTVNADGQLKNSGTTTANGTLNVTGGNVEVTNGTLNATQGATVTGGSVEISGGKLNADGKDIVLNSGNLTLTGGELDAKNITSNTAVDGDTDATISVGTGSKLNLTPANGETLFNGFDTSKGDSIDVNGELKVTVADGASVAQSSTAGITGAGTLNKEGNGALDLKATNTFANVNVNDGTLDVSANLTTNNLTVNGDALKVKSGAELTAKESAKINGGTVTVEPQGAGEDAKAGSLKVGADGTKNLELNAGTLDVQGKLAAGNIISSDDANNEQKAEVRIASGADVTLTPSDDKALFDGLNTKDGTEATKDIINIAGKLTVNTTAGKTVAQNADAPFSGTGTLAKAGEGTLDLTATGNSIGQVDVDNGKLNVKQGDLTSGTTNINKGTLAVESGATLKNTGALNVGNSDGTSDAKLDIQAGATATVGGALKVNSDGAIDTAGTLTASDKITVAGGNINVTAGTLTANKGAEVNGGSVAISGGKLDAGTNDIALNSGNLTLTGGELDAKNITSNTAADGNAEDATISVGADSKLNLTPANGETLFNGFDTSKGDSIDVNGELKVTVADGASVAQNSTAGITGAGTLNKEGNGALDLKAANTFGNVNVNDGILDVSANLTTNNLTVNGDALNVNADSKLTAKQSATINGGAVTIDDKGTTGTKSGSLQVGANGDKALTLNSGSLTVNGDLAASNIKSNEARDDDNDNASITVGSTGNVSLKPTATDGELFAGFDTSKGDLIAVNGNLNVDVAEGVTTAQNANAKITGEGTLNKNGNGELDLKAENTFGNVNVNDGTLDVSANLTTNNLTVTGDALNVKSGTELTAKESAKINGGTVTVEPAGTGENATAGSLKVGADGTKNLELNAGTLDVQGKLAAGNIISSDDANNEQKAEVRIASGADVTLTPSDDKALFEGLNTKDGTDATKDIIDIAGKLTVNTTAGKTVEQNADAPFSGTGTLAKAGEGTLDLTATGNSIGQVDVDNGKLNVKQGDLTSGTTNINKGTLAVESNATLTNNGPLNVGNSSADGKDAKLDIQAGATATVGGALTVNADGAVDTAGTLTANDKITVAGGDLNVTAGTLTANKGAEVNGGNVAVSGGKLDAGTNDIALNSGKLSVTGGELAAKNITSNANPTEATKAVIDVAAAGTLSLNPANGDTLFNGFDTANGDKIGVGGTLNVAVPENGTVSQATTAGISANEAGEKGTLNKNGAGELKLTAPTNTLATTNVNDGKLAVESGSTLNSDTVKVGDGNGDDNSAGLTNNGTVEATSVTVNGDGHLTNTNKLTATDNITVNGGDLTSSGTTNTGTLNVNNDADVNITAGKVTADTTNINDGDVTVVANAELDSDTLKVGDGQGGPNTATLTNNGKVKSDNVTVNSDAKLTNTGTLNAEESLTVNGGAVALNGGTTTTPKTEINAGSVEVATGAKLDSDTLKVGDGQGGPNTASLTNNGTVESDNVTVNSDAKLTNTGTLKADEALTVNGGAVALNGGTTTTPKTDINAGSVEVATGAKLDSDTLKVGDGEGGKENAKLTNNGTVDAKNVTVNADAKLTNTGTLNAEESLTVNGGAVALNGGTTTTPKTDINAGSVEVAANATLDSKAVNVGDGTDGTNEKAALTNNGTVNADNVTVSRDGTLTSAGKLAVKDNLTVDGGELTSSGTTTAGTLTADNGADVNITGGELEADTTNIKDGEVSVDNGATLDTNTLKVGNGTGGPDSAKLTNNGTVEADNVTVSRDGNLTTTGTLDVENGLTVDGGELTSSGTTTAGTLTADNGADVNITGGELEADTTNIKDGEVSVDNGATLDTNTLKVGNGTGGPDSAKLTNNGTVEADDVTVSRDGNLTTTGTLDVENGLTIDGGELTSSGTTTAGTLTADNGADVNITGGELEADTTNIKDGEVSVDNGATLDTNTLKVGNGTGEPDSAKLTNNGTVEADNVTVSGDGNLTTTGTLDVENGLTVDGGELTSSGTTTAGTLTVDKGGELNSSGTTTVGTLNVDNGANVNITDNELAADTTNINDGNVTVSKGATLDTNTLKVGNKTGEPDSAKLTNNGTVEADNVTVSGDGNLTTTGDLDVDNGLTVDGGELTSSGNTTAGTLTADNGADVNITGGELAADTTDIKDGEVSVDKGATLDTDTLKVGDGTGEAGSAKLTNNGTVEADDMTVQKDAEVNVGDADNAGSLDVKNAIAMDGGKLAVAPDSEVSAANITSTPATDNPSLIDIAKNATLNLNPKDGDTLFEGFDTANGDKIGVGGTLNVDVPADGTVSQASTAGISANEAGDKGTLNKNGEGELKLTAPENTLAATNINDGKATVVKGSKLNSESVTVGSKETDKDGDDSTSPDTLVVEGEMVADNLSVDESGALNVAKNGEVTANKSAKINGGSVTVDAKDSDDADSKAGSLKVGENGDKALEVNKGSLTVNGDLTAANIVSDPSQATDDDNASITIGEKGNLNLKPTDARPLFDGLNTGEGDSIAINGNLNLDIDGDKTVALAPTAALSGRGALNKNGEGTLEVSNQNPDFTGKTNVNKGTLAMKDGGDLAGSQVTVNQDATLSVDENGTKLGGLTVEPNGNVEIGITPDKVGTLDVKNDVNLNGGTLTLNTKNIDRVEDLDTSKVLSAITAGGNLTGTFDDIKDTSNLFNFDPTYTENGLTFTPRYEKDSLVEIASERGLTRALGAAKVLDNVFRNNSSDPLAKLFYGIKDDDETAAALVSVLPSLSGASSQIIADSSKQLATLPDYNYQCDAYSNFDGNPTWVRTFHSQRLQHQYKGASGYYNESYGFGIGAERCYNGSRFGAMIGYAQDSAVSRESPSAQSVKSKTVQTGIYGNTPLAGDLALDYKAGVGYSKVDSERKFSFVGNTASASYGNKIAYAGLGLTLPSSLSDTVKLESYARLDYRMVRNNAYAEKGAGILNLHADAGSFETMTSEVGVKVKVQVAPNLLVGANANVGYNLMAEPASVRASFQGAKGQSFVTQGAQENRLSTGAGVSVDYKLSPLASLSVGYDVSSRKGSVEQTPSVSFKMVF
ncbi:autotransporter-associated beta strand repeat-containing protein [Gallibacterium trehalosifermentans]|uniref:Autotransporter-associated beta strand repeat-containing protein n=1 Tax=Gallibacterium trehalosifermentans TaxID=516935 RepID=A0ABV6H0E4_9PAST